MRTSGRHEVVELSVRIRFEGGFSESYTNAANSRVLPTDTIKNTVYVVARERPVVSIEEFARDLARHFLDRIRHLDAVTVEIEQTLWLRIGKSDAAFIQDGRAKRCTALRANRSSESLTSGIRDLEILKTSDSAFSGFMKDELTTLLETQDRLLGTILNADWTFRPGNIDFNDCYSAIRETMLETFAGHRSESVQHTLFAIAGSVLERFPVLEEIKIVMPNQHRLLVDLSRFGLDNPNQIFVSTDEPSGYIEAKLTADRRTAGEA